MSTIEMRVKIKEINYGDVAIMALSVLDERDLSEKASVRKMVVFVKELPEESIRTLLDMFSKEQLNEFLSLLIAENQEAILRKLEKRMEEKGIGLKVGKLELHTDGEMILFVKDIAYQSILAAVAPKKKKWEIMLKAMRMSTRDGRNGLETMLLSLINRNQERILSWISHFAAKNGVRAQLDDLQVKSNQRETETI